MCRRTGWVFKLALSGGAGSSGSTRYQALPSKEGAVREVLDLGRCHLVIEVRVWSSGGNVSIWYAKDYSASLSTSLLDSSSLYARLAQFKRSWNVNQCRDLKLDLPVIAQS